MRAIQRFSWTRRVAGLAVLGAAAMVAACGSVQTPAALAQAAPVQGASPTVVNCEPNQRAVIRPAVVNGAAVSQVDCVSQEAQPLVAAPRVATRSVSPRF